MIPINVTFEVVGGESVVGESVAFVAVTTQKTKNAVVIERVGCVSANKHYQKFLFLIQQFKYP